jgi:hypothetical protein
LLHERLGIWPRQVELAREESPSLVLLGILQALEGSLKTFERPLLKRIRRTRHEELEIKRCKGVSSAPSS